MTLFSGGFSIASQKLTTGQVNWKTVAVDTAIGAIGGPIGKGVGFIGKKTISSLTSGAGKKLLSKAGTGIAEKVSTKAGKFANGNGMSIAESAISGGIEQGSENVANYSISNDPNKSVSEGLKQFGVGMVTGGIFMGGKQAATPASTKVLAEVDSVPIPGLSKLGGTQLGHKANVPTRIMRKSALTIESKAFGGGQTYFNAIGQGKTEGEAQMSAAKSATNAGLMNHLADNTSMSSAYKARHK